MTSLHTWFANPLSLPVRVALMLLPPLATFGLLALLRRRRALAQLASRSALYSLMAAGRRRWWLFRGTCLFLGLVLLVLGIAGPQWGRDYEKSAAPGRDLVLVLDLSRSMLAEDVQPNRAEKARAALADLSRAIQQRGGHRLALVAFTDRPLVVCPLTHDYELFREKLEKLDHASFCALLEKLDASEPAGQLSSAATSASGTRMGAALVKAVEVQEERYRGYQDILLISDGDDPAGDNEWRAGIAAARKQGIPIHTVGIGDPVTGSPIPVRGRFVLSESDGAATLQYDGKEVRTRLQEKPLEEIAHRTGGRYIPARTNDLPLGELFEQDIEHQGVREDSEEALTMPVYRQRYPWFFGAALALLAVEMVVGQYRRKSP